MRTSLTKELQWETELLPYHQAYITAKSEDVRSESVVWGGHSTMANSFRRIEF